MRVKLVVTAAGRGDAGSFVWQATETYVLGLITSMQERGYDLQLGDDIGTVLVGRDGTLLKSSNGYHRFAVAREVGVNHLPVRIAAIHVQWAPKG